MPEKISFWKGEPDGTIRIFGNDGRTEFTDNIRIPKRYALAPDD